MKAAHSRHCGTPEPEMQQGCGTQCPIGPNRTARIKLVAKGKDKT